MKNDINENPKSCQTSVMPSTAKKTRNAYDKLVAFVAKYGLNAKKETELREIIKEILNENKK